MMQGAPHYEGGYSMGVPFMWKNNLYSIWELRGEGMSDKKLQAWLLKQIERYQKIGNGDFLEILEVKIKDLIAEAEKRGEVNGYKKLFGIMGWKKWQNYCPKHFGGLIKCVSDDNKNNRCAQKNCPIAKEVKK